MPTKVKSLPEALRDIIEDAERYRCLREHSWRSSSLCVVVNPKAAVKPGHDCPSHERLDELIDDLRKKGS